MLAQMINRVLETIWNKMNFFHSPINYFLFSKGRKKLVVQNVMINGELKQLIFVSKQLLYSRAGRFFIKKARLYRVEVIMSSSDDLGGHPSKIFMVPELCGSVFRNTLIPHSCAINFVIAKIKVEQ